MPNTVISSYKKKKNTHTQSAICLHNFSQLYLTFTLITIYHICNLFFYGKYSAFIWHTVICEEITY